jgi:hypothetical protein
MRTSIATVSRSGSLVEKLHACAAAGFDGVEIFEPDLIAGDHSPEEIRALAHRLGLRLDLYQPLRDLEGVDEASFADNLSIPDNYYDYLAGRFGLAPAHVAQLRELDLLYDRGPDGYFVHFYTRTVGSVFFEFVQRFGHYDGYGTDNAPVRLAAQRAGLGTVRP